MNENGTSIESWFQSLADDALDRNYKSECTWTKYKDDLEETKKILSWLPTKLKHDVMVPIGGKALMRGKLVHTNELLVNLGGAWFVKKSASQTVDVCNRRIKECDVMLEKLKKERELLESKKSLPAEKEAFGSDERPEIIEYVTEEEHEEWKKQHRKKEREYRQKLAEINNKNKKPIETEEDLWNHLDELELREELEDELNRLGAETDDDNDEEDYEDDDDDDDDVGGGGGVKEEEEEEEGENQNVGMKGKKENVKELTEDSECVSLHKNISCPHLNESKISKNDEVDEKKGIKNRKLSVSFAVDLNNSTDSEPLMLEIRHSSVEPEVQQFQGVINSPGDIYQAYLKILNPKSILKCSVNVNQEKEFEAIKNETETENENENEAEVEFNIGSGIVLPDIYAKNTSISGNEIEMSNRVSSYKEPPKRISKFKASRMKKS